MNSMKYNNDMINNDQIFALICNDNNGSNLETLRKFLGHTDILYRSIDSNDLTMLHIAVLKKKHILIDEIARLMSDLKGIDVQDCMGRTPLHYAASKGDKSILKTMILGGSTIDAMTISGETPLMKAIMFYQINSVEILLRYGANPYATKLDDNKTCIALAAELKNTEIINMIQKYVNVFEKITMMIYSYEKKEITDNKSILNLKPDLFMKLIKYIIP